MDMYVHVFSILGIYSFFTFKLINVKVLKFIFCVSIILIISSLISSTIVLKQDLFSSLIATQHIFKTFSVFYLYVLIKKNRINFTKIFKFLIKIIWFYTLFIIYMSITDFSFVFKSSISGDELLITANKLQKDLLYFGQLYFFAKYLFSKKSINLLYIILIFCSTQLYDIQRGDIIFLISTLLISVFLFKRYISVHTLFSIGLISTLFICILTFSAISENITEKFNQFSLVFSADEKIDDPSIFVRLSEISFAIEGFSEHPYTGHGLIRGSKKSELIGDIYFYPADIGLVGVMYSFGIIGLCVFLLFLRKIYLIDRFGLNFVNLGFYLYLIYSLLYTFKDGQVIFEPTRFLLCYLLIHLTDNVANKKSTNIKL
jgi:hypothetical protein